MEVNDLEILLIDVTFYFYHARKLIFNVLIKNNKINITGPLDKGSSWNC